MKKQLKLDDYLDLQEIIKGEMQKYEISEEIALPLLSDILFQSAAFYDERCGTHHHENIEEFLESNVATVSSVKEKHKFLFMLQIRLGVGKAHEASFTKADAENEESLKVVVERMLGIRNNYDERTNRTFGEIVDRRKGINSVSFSSREFPSDSDWKLLPFQQGDDGQYGVTGICNCIAKNILEEI